MIIFIKFETIQNTCRFGKWRRERIEGRDGWEEVASLPSREINPDIRLAGAPAGPGCKG